MLTDARLATRAAAVPDCEVRDAVAATADRKLAAAADVMLIGA